jgi:hypothetical protein
MKTIRKHIAVWICLLVTHGMVCSFAQDEARGVVASATSIQLDGQEIAALRVGQTVTILGENNETNELLVSHETADGQTVVGLIPAGSVVIAGGGRVTTPGGEAPRPGTTGAPTSATPPAQAELDFSKPVTAEQLGEFLQANRGDFDRFRNQRVVVRGIVGEASVLGRGTSQQVAVVFRMPTNLPKIKVTMSPTYLMGEDFRKRFNFGADYYYSVGQTVNFRGHREGVQAQVVWERTDTYTYGGNRQYQSKSKSESAWIPVLSVGSAVTLEGILSDFRFEVQINDAKFAD